MSKYKRNDDKKIPRANKEITAQEVRLIDELGEMLGVVKLTEALNKALSAGLDLVEISPNVSPPVCKIIDFGKYKYEMKKKTQQAKKKQKTVEIKEIKVRPNIAEHDYQTKMRNLVKFIESGNKVKVTLRFRGREIAHQNLGLEIFKRIINENTEISKIELAPKLDGRQIIMVLVPKLI